MLGCSGIESLWFCQNPDSIAQLCSGDTGELSQMVGSQNLQTTRQLAETSGRFGGSLFQMAIQTRKNKPDHARDGQVMIQPYLDEIQKIPLLTIHEERSLAVRVSQGDAEARDRLIRSNLRLVVNMARNYVGRGIGFEDLIEEGNLGLMRAVESFDPTAETRFSTYAVYWIKQSMRRVIVNHGKLVRFPAYLVNLISKWNQASRSIRNATGREPTETEVAELMDLPEKKMKLIQTALHLLRAMPCQQETLTEDDSVVAEVISDQKLKPTEDLAHEHDCMNRIHQSLEYLDEVEAEFIRLRFGLINGVPLGIQEIANRLRMTRDRAKYLELRSIERLRILSKNLA